jgi:PAS domain S-box-containing protein
LHQGDGHLGEWCPIVPSDAAPAGTAADAGRSACDCRSVLSRLAECRTALTTLSHDERLAVLCTLAAEAGLNVVPAQAGDLDDPSPLISADQLNWAKDFVSQVVLSDALMGVALQLDESKQEIDGIAERLAHVAEHPLGAPDDRWVHHGRLFERTAAGVFACDLGGRFLDINASALRLLGYGAKDALRLVHTFETLFADPGAWQTFRTALHADYVVRGTECDLVRRDGPPARVLLTAVLVHSRDGTPLGFEGVWVSMPEAQPRQEGLVEAQRVEAAQGAISALRQRIAAPLEALCEASRLLLEQCEAEGRDVGLALAVSDVAAKLAEELIAAGPSTSPGPAPA